MKNCVCGGTRNFFYTYLTKPIEIGTGVVLSGRLAGPNHRVHYFCMIKRKRIATFWSIPPMIRIRNIVVFINYVLPSKIAEYFTKFYFILKLAADVWRYGRMAGVSRHHKKRVICIWTKGSKYHINLNSPFEQLSHNTTKQENKMLEFKWACMP